MNSQQIMPDDLYGQMKQADIDHTEDHGINELSDWDEMLECEVKHYNNQNNTKLDPKEMRIQYIERQEKELGYA